MVEERLTMAKNDIDPAILKSYVEAERKRKILASDAEQQEKLVKVYKDQILAWLNSKGQNTARRAGFTVSISDGPKCRQSSHRRHTC